MHCGNSLPKASRRIRRPAGESLRDGREGSRPDRNPQCLWVSDLAWLDRTDPAALAETRRRRHGRALTRDQRHGLHRARLLYRHEGYRQRRVLCQGGAQSLGDREQSALGARCHVPRRRLPGPQRSCAAQLRALRKFALALLRQDTQYPKRSLRSRRKTARAPPRLSRFIARPHPQGVNAIALTKAKALKCATLPSKLCIVNRHTA